MRKNLLRKAEGGSHLPVSPVGGDWEKVGTLAQSSRKSENKTTTSAGDWQK